MNEDRLRVANARVGEALAFSAVRVATGEARAVVLSRRRLMELIGEAPGVGNCQKLMWAFQVAQW